MRRRNIVIMGAAGATVVVAAGAGGAYAVLRTEGSPAGAAAEFLAAWERGDAAAMRRLARGPADPAAPYGQMRSALGVTGVRAAPGRPRAGSGGARRRVPFTATVSLRGGGSWSYGGELPMTDDGGRWRVAWTPRAVHPRLAAGGRFALAARWPRRGRILAADGSRVDGPGEPGSVRQIAGTVGRATAAEAGRLGAPYRRGDPVGRGGLQQGAERTLAGTPETVITVIGPGGAGDPGGSGGAVPVGRISGRAGADVRTSLDRRVQAAAARAITRQGKPAALVALRPSTGEILAAANQPGGFSRALVGRYPPGSTFKVVTAAALLGDGLRPADRVDCTKTAAVGGRSFRNFEDEEFGPIDFRTAFAHSCNTVFATETARRLDARQLARAARDFGFGVPVSPGVPAARGGFPLPRDGADLAASAFGQGRVLASPLTMAGVAAAARDGAWRPPTLLARGRAQAPGQAPAQGQGRVRRLDPGVAAGLRSMMAAVVTSGTAKAARLPAGTAGKTGTAEYGGGPKPPTHAWFIGFRGDLAFAVLVEGGGTGGEKAAPLAGDFLRGL